MADTLLMLKFQKAAKAAKTMGFDRVWVEEFGDFKAEDTQTGITVTAGTQHGDQYYIEIGWPSAGIPRPDDAKIKRHIVILHNAMQLKQYLK